MSPSSSTSPDPPSAGQRPLPWPGLTLATLAALALHVALVSGLPLGLGSGREGSVAPLLTVRQIVLPPPAVATMAEPPPPAPRPQPKRRGSAPPEAPLVAAAPEPATAPQQVPEPAPPPIPDPLAALPLPPNEPAASAPALALAPPPEAAPESGGKPIPTYATQRPRGAVLQFELRRAGLTGSGELVWRPNETGYAAALNGTAFGLPVLSWSSQGRFDADGIAPDRFVDQRRQRDVRAASFQRDKGRITFSGPPIEHALVPGAQDRLSWMLQLPAIIAADPSAFGPGARISMFVAGARGDADVWTFVVEAREAVDVVEGRIEGALKLLREPRKPYDTRVEVWLDPAREFLPVKLNLVQANSGEGFEFSLRGMAALP